MTRKDYEKIAQSMCRAMEQNKEVLKKARDSGWERDAEMFAEGFGTALGALAHALKSDNERFDTHRFLKACGVYNGKL